MIQSFGVKRARTLGVKDSEYSSQKCENREVKDSEFWSQKSENSWTQRFRVLESKERELSESKIQSFGVKRARTLGVKDSEF